MMCIDCLQRQGVDVCSNSCHSQQISTATIVAQSRHLQQLMLCNMLTDAATDVVQHADRCMPGAEAGTHDLTAPLVAQHRCCHSKGWTLTLTTTGRTAHCCCCCPCCARGVLVTAVCQIYQLQHTAHAAPAAACVPAGLLVR
jgi:hypothetical protein